MAGCNSCTNDKNTLIFACSGGSNVGQMSNDAAKKLTISKHGKMFCAAGIGADLSGFIQTAKDADENIVIDGCGVKCLKASFDKHQITNYKHLIITDLGIEKHKDLSVNENENLEKVIEEVKKLIG